MLCYEIISKFWVLSSILLLFFIDIMLQYHSELKVNHTWYLKILKYYFPA